MSLKGTDMIDIKDFADFAGKQSGSFDYISNTDCALAQYLKDRNPDSDIWVGGDFYNIDGEHHEMQSDLADALTEAGGEWKDLHHSLRGMVKS